MEKNAQCRPTIDRRTVLAGACSLLAGAATAGSTLSKAFGAAPDVSESAPQANEQSRRNALPSPPNIVVFLADALRADHLGCYGCQRPLSPAIDRFSSESTLFQNCFAQSPWTKPSIGSLFTGYSPRVHRATVTAWQTDHLDELPVQVLRDCFTSIAEPFAEAGYATAWFLCNPHVQSEFGYGRGFRDYAYHAGEHPASLVEDAARWLLSRRNEPFLLFIHEIDPHGPYRPPAEAFRALFGAPLANRFAGLSDADRQLMEKLDGFYGRAANEGDTDRPDPARMSEAGRERFQNLYAAEVRGVDSLFQHVLSCLDSEQLLDRTVVALTSDHGESFGEHGLFFHGNELYSPQLHVPLIIRMPGGQESHKVPWTVGLYDLFPTLLELASIEPPPGIQARSLISASGELLVSADRPVLSYLDHYVGDPLQWDAALTWGRWKVMTARRGAERAVFDRATDPAEYINLLDGASDQTGEIRDLLRRFDELSEMDKRLASRFGEPEWSRAPEDMAEQVRALGYL